MHRKSASDTKEEIFGGKYLERSKGIMLSEEPSTSLIKKVLAVLNEDGNDIDLRSCGPAVCLLVQQTNSHLSVGVDPENSIGFDPLETSTSLLRISDEKILSFPYREVPTCWRRLYTDASILIVLAELQLCKTSGDPENNESANHERRTKGKRFVRLLDMTIIVAGAPGLGRKECIFELIKHVQLLFLWDCEGINLLVEPTGDHVVWETVEAATQSNDKQQFKRVSKFDDRPTKVRRLSSGAGADPDTSFDRFQSDGGLVGNVEPGGRSSKLGRPKPIRRLETPPSLEEFLIIHMRQNEPFVLPRYLVETLGWQACKKPGGSLSCGPSFHSLADLLCFDISGIGPGRVVPVEVGGDYTAQGWGQEIVEWDEFLKSVFRRSETDPSRKPDKNENSQQTHPILYLAQHSLLSQFPRLAESIHPFPDYLYASPSPPQWFPAYKPPPENEDGGEWIVNVWVGGAGDVNSLEEQDRKNGTISQAHTDPYFNLFGQIMGRKHVWVAPPHLTREMYPFGPEENRNHADSDDDPSYSSYMSNTSRVHVFDFLSDSLPAKESTFKNQRQTPSQFPLFAGEVLPNSMETTLEEGDLLYLPVGWWHAMKAEGRSWSVSMWF